jgi:hypothetical protein
MPTLTRHRPPWRAAAWLMAFATASWLVACSQPLLNSERIEHRFGSYGVELLEAGSTHRASLLYSLDAAGGRIGRTLALVRFADPLPAGLAQQHVEILAGGSIGAVFRKAGWDVRKTNLELGTFSAGADATLLQNRMQIRVPRDLAMHIYRFTAVKGEQRLNYATIVEIHHPDYLSTGQLEALYGGLPSAAQDPAERALMLNLAQRTVVR